MSKPMGVSRRKILRSASGLFVALPLLETFLPRKHSVAQSLANKRAVFWFVPEGTITDLWMPTGSEKNFSLPAISSVLEPHKNDLIFFKGVHANPSVEGVSGDAHHYHMCAALTGAASSASGSVAPGADGKGTSIDQLISDGASGGTRFQSLEFGVGAENYAENRTRLVYRNGSQIPPESDPAKMYMRLFGADPKTPATGTGGETDAAQIALLKLHAKRRSVLDCVLGELNATKKLVSKADQTKIDEHTTSIRSVERTLLKAGMMGPTAANCANPGLRVDRLGPGPRTGNTPDFQILGELQMELLMLALKCDLTRVATFMWSRSKCEQRYPWLNLDTAWEHHDYSHNNMKDDPVTYRTKVTAIHKWYTQQFAAFLAKMKSVDEMGASLLDNSVVLHISEFGTGNHTGHHIPFAWAGKAGGQVQTGRFLDYSASGSISFKADEWENAPGTGTLHAGRTFKGEPHNRLLLSVAAAMKVNVPSIGKASLGTSGLPGLL